MFNIQKLLERIESDSNVDSLVVDEGKSYIIVNYQLKNKLRISLLFCNSGKYFEVYVRSPQSNKKIGKDFVSLCDINDKIENFNFFLGTGNYMTMKRVYDDTHDIDGILNRVEICKKVASAAFSNTVSKVKLGGDLQY